MNNTQIINSANTIVHIMSVSGKSITANDFRGMIDNGSAATVFKSKLVNSGYPALHSCNDDELRMALNEAYKRIYPPDPYKQMKADFEADKLLRPEEYAKGYAK